MTKPTTLIWHRDVAKVVNRDWIRFLLADVVSDEIVDLEGKICHPYSIIVEDNRCKTPNAFFEAATRHGPVGLFHVFDEYFDFDYGKYRYFDFVIKTWWSSAFEADRILCVPIGYTSDLPLKAGVPLASERPLLWSFAGALKSVRYHMVKSLSDAQPHSVFAPSSLVGRLSKGEYFEVLENSIFAPCPMGNVLLESWRLYESLEAGCIPIIERRPFMRYYERLLSDPPLPFVWNWKEAKRKMLALADDPTELDRMQQEIHQWWERFKSSLKRRIATLVGEGFSRRAGPGPGGVRVKRVAELPGWRYGELLRHQSLQSLRWRVQKNLLGAGL